jgi:hypothetical protein
MKYSYIAGEYNGEELIFKGKSRPLTTWPAAGRAAPAYDKPTGLMRGFIHRIGVDALAIKLCEGNKPARGCCRQSDR